MKEEVKSCDCDKAKHPVEIDGKEIKLCKACVIKKCTQGKLVQIL